MEGRGSAASRGECFLRLRCPLSRAFQGASATGRAPSRARARGARRAAAARRPPRRAPYAGAPRAAADAIPAALPRARRACGDAANLARAHLPRRRHRRRARARAHVWLTRRRSARRRQVRARRLELVRRSAPHARATPRALRSRDPLRLPPTIVVVLQVFPAHQAQVLLARQRAGNRASLLLVSPRCSSSIVLSAALSPRRAAFPRSAGPGLVPEHRIAPPTISPLAMEDISSRVRARARVSLANPCPAVR